ncbi:MAG TPA: permease, partial [Thermoanaerobaculaceae bacterium]|nr:permease [Thermoanaerobaculaceae bacterium]
MNTLPVVPRVRDASENVVAPSCCAAVTPSEPCACAAPVDRRPAPQRHGGLGNTILLAILGAGVWLAVYLSLGAAAKAVTHGLLRLTPGTALAAAVEFFLFEAPKVLLLLAVVVFGVGIVRSFFTAERTRRILAGQREAVGNVLAALLGVVTPFCSCSAVPLFIGFVTTGVPLGVTFSFLISAPMVNEIALVLLYSLFGWKVATLYMGTGLAISILAGWVIGRLRMERHVEGWVYEIHTGSSAETV